MVRKTKDEEGESGGPTRYQSDLTPVEAEEGRTFLLMQAQPDNARAAYDHALALNRLSRAKGCRWGTQRCRHCGSYLFGRRPGEFCRNTNCMAIVQAIPLPPLHPVPQAKLKRVPYPVRPWTPKPLPADFDHNPLYTGEEGGDFDIVNGIDAPRS